jgi:hypothetical protein
MFVQLLYAMQMKYFSTHTHRITQHTSSSLKVQHSHGSQSDAMHACAMSANQCPRATSPAPSDSSPHDEMVTGRSALNEAMPESKTLRHRNSS